MYRSVYKRTSSHELLITHPFTFRVSPSLPLLNLAAFLSASLCVALTPVSQATLLSNVLLWLTGIELRSMLVSLGMYVSISCALLGISIHMVATRLWLGAKHFYKRTLVARGQKSIHIADVLL